MRSHENALLRHAYRARYRLRSGRYREIADELRLLAPKTKYAEVGEQLRLLAVSYERLAEHAEEASSLPSPDDPLDLPGG